MRTKLPIAILLTVIAIAAVTPSVAAQCSQCREAAAAAADGGKTMNFAIVVLLLPTLVMFVGLLIFAMSRRDSLAVRVQPAAPAHDARLVREPS